jgi:hypothetical protein
MGLQNVAQPYVFRHLRFPSIHHVIRTAAALQCETQRRKVSQWTRKIVFLVSDGDYLCEDLGASIVQLAGSLVELSIGIWTGDASPIAIIAAAQQAAPTTFSRLVLDIGASALEAPFVACIGALSNLRSLRLSTGRRQKTYKPFLESILVGQVLTWKLPMLEELSVDMKGFPVLHDMVLFLQFLSRCQLRALKALRIVGVMNTQRNAAAIATAIADFSHLNRELDYIGLRTEIARTPEDWLDRIRASYVELASLPPLSSILEMDSRVQVLHIHHSARASTDDLFDVLRALSQRAPGTEVARVQLSVHLALAPGCAFYFLWSNSGEDVPRPQRAFMDWMLEVESRLRARGTLIIDCDGYDVNRVHYNAYYPDF